MSDMPRMSVNTKDIIRMHLGCSLSKASVPINTFYKIESNGSYIPIKDCIVIDHIVLSFYAGDNILMLPSG